MHLLLINPQFPDNFWNFQWLRDHVIKESHALNPPLGLATLAALSPSHWKVTIIDENIDAAPEHPTADIIGVCGMGEQLERQKELLHYYREQGYYVVAGGSYASLCPEEYENLVDSVIVGEAEYIWPQFCCDFERGAAKKLYRETGEVDLKDSPVPRYDLLALDKYWASSIQFSRGCPYRCEFCDIIVMFGRKPRTKSPEQVINELEALRKQGVHHVFFVDDNFIGHKREAKALLRAVKEYQLAHGFPFRFGTEATVNIAQDEELLGLMKDANFSWLFIGIETVNKASLKAIKKDQNLKQDSLASLYNIYKFGLDVYGGFIIGFDQDDPSVFSNQHRFIMDAGIQLAFISLLSAIPKTPLYERLARENRLLGEGYGHVGTRLGTNFIPAQMTYEEMVSNYGNLYLSLFDDANIRQRIKKKIRHFSHDSHQPTEGLSYRLVMLGRLLRSGIGPGGPRRWWYFLSSIPWQTPSQFHLAIADWAMALNVKDYCDRNLMRNKE